MQLLLLGMSHRTAALDAREALTFTPEETVRALVGLTRLGDVKEAALLSTCNRTEFYIVTETPDRADQNVRDLVAGISGRDLLAPGPHRYRLEASAAIRHLLRVACGLDSMVLGDVQILGQVKEAHARAKEADSAGPRLDRLFEHALRAGKRARTETTIGAGVVSVGSAAADLLRDQLGSLAGRHVVVVGAGETGRLAARYLVKHHLGSLTLVNRSSSAAGALASDLGHDVRALPLDALEQALAGADAAVCATGAPTALVTVEMVRAAMATRPERPLAIVDIAVPRNVEPDVATVPGVAVHAIDAIQQVVDTSLARRTAEVPRVEQVVDQEAVRYEAWQRGLRATPVVRDLREHFERVRAEEVDRIYRHESAADRDRAERLTRALINRLLHGPTLQLKEADPESEEGSSRLRAARELFALRQGGREVRRGV
jgi:glutamyl-tRNA reductase